MTVGGGGGGGGGGAREPRGGGLTAARVQCACAAHGASGCARFRLAWKGQSQKSSALGVPFGPSLLLLTIGPVSAVGAAAAAAGAGCCGAPLPFWLPVVEGAAACKPKSMAHGCCHWTRRLQWQHFGVHLPFALQLGLLHHLERCWIFSATHSAAEIARFATRAPAPCAHKRSDQRLSIYTIPFLVSGSLPCAMRRAPSRTLIQDSQLLLLDMFHALQLRSAAFAQACAAESPACCVAPAEPCGGGSCKCRACVSTKPQLMAGAGGAKYIATPLRKPQRI